VSTVKAFKNGTAHQSIRAHFAFYKSYNRFMDTQPPSTSDPDEFFEFTHIPHHLHFKIETEIYYVDIRNSYGCSKCCKILLLF
jgi:hypothetical protein